MDLPIDNSYRVLGACRFEKMFVCWLNLQNYNGDQMRGLHSTEVAFELLTQQPRVRLLVFPKNIK